MRIQIADYVESGLFTKWIFYYQSEYVINHHWSNLLSERIFIIIASFTWANYWLSVRILITRANIYYQMISIIKASFSIIAHNFNRANVVFFTIIVVRFIHSFSSLFSLDVGRRSSTEGELNQNQSHASQSASTASVHSLDRVYR